MSPRILLAAAILAAVACASAQVATGPLTKREFLRAVAPIALEALTRLENRRGSPFDDSELDVAMKSDAFQREYRSALSEFCARPANARVLACSRGAGEQASAPTGPAVDGGKR